MSVRSCHSQQVAKGSSELDQPGLMITVISIAFIFLVVTTFLKMPSCAVEGVDLTLISQVRTL